MRSTLSLVACAGCAAGLGTSPKPDAAAPIENLGGAHAVSGEEMEYEVRFRGIAVGGVQVLVGKPGEIEGRHAVIVRAHGASTGVIDLIGQLTWDMKSTVDLESGYALHEEEEFTAVVAGNKKHGHTDDTWDYSAAHHGVLSAAAGLRGWRSHIGARTQAKVHFGHAGIDVELRDSGREMIGDKPAARYSGVEADHFAIEIWISDDVARVPLRVHCGTRFGDIDVDLVHYEAPRDQ